MGLRIQLSHPVGDICLNPHIPKDDFVIIDTHGIHEVTLAFCACHTAVSHAKQLLRYRLLPATATNPKTAATFNVMERFQLESFEGKVSVFEFYYSLARASDNTGLVPPKVCGFTANLLIFLYLLVSNRTDMNRFYA